MFRPIIPSKFSLHFNPTAELPVRTFVLSEQGGGRRTIERSTRSIQICYCRKRPFSAEAYNQSESPTGGQLHPPPLLLHANPMAHGDGNSNGVTRVLFCSSYSPASHNYTIEYLSKYVDDHIKVDVIPNEEVPNAIANYHICIVKMTRLSSDILSRAKQLKLILQFGVGLEGVDIDAATKRGIKVARIPATACGNAASCAELAVYLMLGLLRKQHEMHNSVQSRVNGEPMGETLFGKTVFIMGLGSLGIELAKRLKLFGVRVIATKRRWGSKPQDSCEMIGSPAKVKMYDDFVDMKGSPNDIYNFASRADIVVCCLCLNSETVGTVNESFLSSMKKGAHLVNIARGGLLDYDAVIKYLKSGYLGGLGIDVAWNEPLDPKDQILSFPNVLITPHVGGVTETSYRNRAKIVGDVVLQLHRGTPISGIEIVN